MKNRSRFIKYFSFAGCWQIVVFVLLHCITSAVFGQDFNFKKFVEPEGLNNRFVYTIDQDENGYLLIGTGDGMYRFDGSRFKSFTTNDSLAENYITCSFKDSHGIIWFGHNNGKLTWFSNGVLHPLKMPDTETNSRVCSIAEDPQGFIWVATQTSGLIKVSPKHEVTFYPFGIEDEYLTSILIDHAGRIWLGSGEGLINCTVNTRGEIICHWVTELEGKKIESIALHPDEGIIAATEDSGICQVMVRQAGFKVTAITCEGLDLSHLSLNNLTAESDGTLWLCTRGIGLVSLTDRKNNHYGKYQSFRDKNNTNWSISTHFVDRENNIWIGTQGEGLFRLIDDYFTMYYPCDISSKCDISSFAIRNDSAWCTNGQRLYLTTSGPRNFSLELDMSQVIGADFISSIAIEENGFLWIGTGASGIFKYNPRGKKLTPIEINDDKLSKSINHIACQGDFVYVATGYGMYQMRNGEIVSHISITSGLSHNVVNTIFKDSKKRIWLGTPNEITFIENGIIEHLKAPDDHKYIETLCFTEDGKGNIWVGTNGAGVIRVSGDSLVFYSKQRGLFNNYCSSIISDKNDNIWVGHRGGVSKIHSNTFSVEVFHPGRGVDLLFLRNASVSTPGKAIWFGTSDGILQYTPELDLINSAEPLVQITGITISDSLYAWADEIHLPYGKYEISLSFIGVSLRKTDLVKYQIMLEGYDQGWSPPTSQNSIRYNQLSPGEYTFKVRSYNADGIGGKNEREIKFTIGYPFWQQWWFIIGVVIAVFLAVRYVVIRRERFLRENQAYLQTELAARTVEVVSQKELLEIKNKDITDSIHYAKNIQKAMLPSPGSLSKVFSDSFVYYKPRDIVSGDFYWVDTFGQKIIVACADCTGHGVPGAFMSLIGSTILKELSRASWIQSPDALLSELDLELRNTLKGEDNVYGVEDGMDISLLEYDTTTREIRACSANRPIVVYSKGKRVEFKGDRHQIGGGSKEQQKTFTLHTMQLLPGDVVYMFSDGITDQFGGSAGKKMKKSGLFKLLDEIAHFSMDQQRKLIKETFLGWKGELEQIDDIILLGIRV